MNIRRRLAVATLCIVSAACSAGEPATSPAAAQPAEPQAASSQTIPASDAPPSDKSASMVETSAPSSTPSSVCSAGDEVVFSCPLATGSKIASICASKSAAGTEPGFYYAFGRSGAPELRFPASGHTDNAAFGRTHLGFAGNTGGYAYSFSNAGYKYIVYSVSGAESSRDGGVIVQPSDQSKSLFKLACRSTAITETRDESVIDATLRLKKDPQIQSRGLPNPTKRRLRPSQSG